MVKKDLNEMSFLDHLEDLRWHLIRIVVAIVLVGMLVFIFSRFVFDGIIFAPLEMKTFPTYNLLCNAANYIKVETTFCAEEMPLILQNRTMAGQFSADIWTAILGGFIISFPYVIYQLWRFISPGLHENERKHSKGFIIISSLLFFLGVLFGYYVITPLSLNFLANYSISKVVDNQIDISSYIGLVRSSALAAGLIFELPIIIYFLTKIGLVTPEILRKYRKYALVIVLILSAIITPPDVASQVIVAIPILILYQVSIYISKIVIRNQNRKEKENAMRR
jgi:sec-independent protein translocase protein TatC